MYDLLNLPKTRATPLPAPRPPRLERVTLAPEPNRPDSFTASVAHIKLDDRNAMQSLSDSSRPVAEKQQRCWDTYERNPLLARGISFLGNSIGRLRVVPAYDDGTGDGPVENWDNPRMNKILEDLDQNVEANGSMSGINYLFRQVSVHLVLTGESFFYARAIEDESGSRRAYSVYSTDELRRNTGRMEYVAFPGATPMEIRTGPNADGYLLRFWKPSERWAQVAHSEIFSALDDMDDWEMLTAALAAGDKSRISAGMLVYPGDVTFPAVNGRKGGNEGYVESLTEHLTKPVRDRRSAASIAPFISAGWSNEQVEKMKWMTFGRQPSEFDVKRLEELKQRISMIMPIPPETYFGKEGLSHWAGYLVNEDEWKSIEPTAQLTASVITRGPVRPTLIAMGENPEEAAKWWLWYDEVDLVHRPDQTGTATEGAKLGFVGGKGWREIAGIPQEAAPVDDADRAMPQGPQSSPVLPGQESRAEPTQVAPAGITAALTPQQTAVTKLGPKLSRLDRDLKTKLQLGAEIAVKESVKRVGAKLRSKLNPDQKRQFATTTNYELPAHLGRATVAILGVDAPKTIATSLESFLTDADKWMRGTWEQAAAAISAALGIQPPAEPQWAQVGNQLRNELQAEGEIRLWNPHPTMPDKGEWGEGLTASVLPGIRRVLQFVGGETGEDLIGGFFNEGIATGRRMMDTLIGGFKRLMGDEAGASLKTVYVWEHVPGLREFPSHADLDGVEFEAWDDPVLAVRPEDEWLDTPFYHPSDHDGCLCGRSVELRLEVV